MGKIIGIDLIQLAPGPSTPGIERKIAFKEDGVTVIRSQVDPGVVSGWHHHGNYHVYGYMAAGTIRFEFGVGGKETVEIKQGGYFHVPPDTIHRDVNPSKSAGQDVILFLCGDGEMVVNVDGPDK
jgi:quercetin dioxygenase-like cupin family protein